MESKNLKLLVNILFTLILIFFISSVFAFTGNSSNYSLRSKYDSAAQTNSISSSFNQRFILGMQPVSQYETSSFTGRLGILELSASNITIVNPSNNSIITRGSDSVANEDDLGLISNTIILKSFLNNLDNNLPIQNINCSFYFDNIFIGSDLSNSSGHCFLSYDKSSKSVGSYIISVNYSSVDYDVQIQKDTFNITIVSYNLPNFAGGKGDALQYADNQTAIFYMNVTKTNSSGITLYDPANITINASTSANILYPESAYIIGYRLKRNGVGQYESRVVVNLSLGSFIKWNLYASDDNYTTYIATAVHSDIGIEGASCGNGIVETGEQCDDGNLVAGDGCSATCTTEGGGGGGGGGSGGGESCTNECTSGETQNYCVTGSALRTRTCGSYDSDSCTEWGGDAFTDCGEGMCSNAQCTSCVENWQCSDWNQCSSGTQTRTCNDLNNCGTVNNKPETSQSCSICIEDWKCSWTECNEGDISSSPYDCIDLNNCGTQQNKPSGSIDCKDVPPEYIPIIPGQICSELDWSCTQWSECIAEYDIENVLNGDVSKKGLQERNCNDLSQCAVDKIEKRSCDLAIPIKAVMTEWCKEKYIELFDLNSNKLVTRIKESKISEVSNLSRIDVSLITTEFGGYCNSCYNGLKDNDETNVDCGGSCQSCLEKYTYFDWVFWLILLLIIIFTILNYRYYKTEDGEIRTEFKDFYEKLKEIPWKIKVWVKGSYD